MQTPAVDVKGQCRADLSWGKSNVTQNLGRLGAQIADAM